MKVLERANFIDGQHLWGTEKTLWKTTQAGGTKKLSISGSNGRALPDYGDQFRPSDALLGIVLRPYFKISENSCRDLVCRNFCDWRLYQDAPVCTGLKSSCDIPQSKPADLIVSISETCSTFVEVQLHNLYLYIYLCLCQYVHMYIYICIYVRVRTSIQPHMQIHLQS